MTSPVVVFRPRAGTWLLHGFLTLVIAVNSLYWFFDPVPAIVRYLGGAGIIIWISYLVSLARARVELREDTVEVFGPSYQVVHPRPLHWLYPVLFLLVAADLVSLLVGPLPLWALRCLLGLRIAWLFGYLWCFGVLEGVRRSVKYTEIATPPREGRLTATATVLQMGTSSSANLFSFPSWLKGEDRSEVAGRITARMKHAQAWHPDQDAVHAAAHGAAANNALQT